jgi:hypothetical protein
MMTAAGDPPAPSDSAPRWRSGRWIPFWVLQTSELALAVVLADLSIHVPHGQALIAAAAILFVLALTADGPLGILRVVGKRTHVQLAVVVAIVFGVAVWLPVLHADSEEKVVVMVVSIGLIRLATLTRTSGMTGRGRWRKGAGNGEVIEATATATPVSPPPEPREVESEAETAFRKAGRTTGAAAAAGKRAVDEHRPQVEDQVKRTLRGAGRLAGRFAGPKSPPDPPA